MQFPQRSTRATKGTGIYSELYTNHREPGSSNTFKNLQTLKHNAETYCTHLKKQTREHRDLNQD